MAPDRPGNYKFSYDITDRGGAPVTGYGTLTVDEQAPLTPPVAVDDRLPGSAVLGKTEVEVPVLKNDNDPDGSQDDLRIEVESPGIVESGQVRVPVSDDPRYCSTPSPTRTAAPPAPPSSFPASRTFLPPSTPRRFPPG